MEEKRESTLQKDEIEKIKKADASVKAMEDFTSPEVLYDELISSVKKYHPSTDITMIEKAFNIANNAHKGQVRKSGEPYIIHPLCVAIILADLELDKETIVADLLPDVVEDTVMTSEEIRQEFGDEVELLVDGVTKLGQLSYSADKVEVQAENLRKMFLAMGQRHPGHPYQTGGPAPQYADTEIYASCQAEGKGQRDHGYLRSHCSEIGYFQGKDRAG